MNTSVVKYLLIAVVLISAVGISAWLLQMQKPTVPPALQGMGGDFQLESATGPVSLHDFRGKVMLVYFGYTHCPDVCPMALGVMADAMRQAGASQADQLGGIFISVDPRRDTPAILDHYAAFFDKRIRGLTGTREQLDKVTAKWRVDYAVPDQPAEANYEVEHTNFIYLVNPDGKIADLFDEETDPAFIADRIRPWLR